ncbi:MAG: hypothetical protein JW728_07300 [Candidatus Aureabacteria bacterium]|nr:hypothetical protein [Candidatus Auribacterota bacterium]
MKAFKETSVRIITDDRPGLFFVISSELAKCNVNIKAICAFREGEKAYFYLLTDNCKKSVELLDAAGLNASIKDVVTVLAENKVGEASKISEKIKDEGINLDFLYGTTSSGSGVCMMVMGSKDNDRLIRAING